MGDGLRDLQLTNSDRDLLNRIQQDLSLLADLARADLVLYCYEPTLTILKAIGEARPNTVPSIYPESQVDKEINRDEDPTLWKVLSRGRHEQRFNRVLVRGAPTVQDIYPIKNAGWPIAALSFEMGLVERERQRRKSLVFRRAITQLRDMVLRGELDGGRNIAPLGEHDGPLIVDSTGDILYISSIAENLYRKLDYTQSLLHTKIGDLRTDESVVFKALENGACVEQMVTEGPFTWVKKAIPLMASRSSSWRARFLPSRDEIDGAIVVIHDITAERRKERELKIKSAMIAEIHHRVKNNLQTIAALLRLQARRTLADDVGDMLNQTINRILSIAVVHEFLSQDESSVIDIKEVCQRIINEVVQSILDPERRIKFVLEGDSVYLPAQQATSCALIVNELLQNAVEHGFEGRARTQGMVSVNLRDNGNDMTVEIVDNGRGLAPGFSMSKNASLGLQIVQTLVTEDLKGKFDLSCSNGVTRRGVTALVTFPKFRLTNGNTLFVGA
ncbi:MAG: sensor histidine kinase [Chloroflexi bacterium]|nr:sensor histidine kinase [Chloroflexota bacterium]